MEEKKQKRKREDKIDCVTAMNQIPISRRSKGVMYSLYGDQEKTLKQWEAICKKEFNE